MLTTLIVTFLVMLLVAYALNAVAFKVLPKPKKYVSYLITLICSGIVLLVTILIGNNTISEYIVATLKWSFILDYILCSVLIAIFIRTFTWYRTMPPFKA